MITLVSFSRYYLWNKRDSNYKWFAVLIHDTPMHTEEMGRTYDKRVLKEFIGKYCFKRRTSTQLSEGEAIYLKEFIINNG